MKQRSNFQMHLEVLASSGTAILKSHISFVYMNEKI